MPYDFNEIIQRRIFPTLVDTVFYKDLQGILSLMRKVSTQSGDRITVGIRTANTSNNAAYDKSSVDVASASQTLVKAYWTKAQYNGCAETFNIDEANNVSGDVAIDFAKGKIEEELKAMGSTIFDAIMSRLAADIDSSGTAYSDASLSRSTYATLASYEETSSAAQTLALWRATLAAAMLNKNVARQDYICLMAEDVMDTFAPLAAATHTLTHPAESFGNNGVSYGYAPVSVFDGIPIYCLKGQTSGTVFFAPRQSLCYAENMPMRIEAKNSERDSRLFQIYYGITPFVLDPGFCAKQTGKS